jgi:uncharacterized membrane-anchored protein YitT (DUF2179 family)
LLLLALLAEALMSQCILFVRLLTHIIALDRIHTIYKYMKITIITTKVEEMRLALIGKFNHGITIFNAVGGYTNQPRWALESIVLAYEIEEYRNLAKQIDEHVFVPIPVSTELMEVQS